MEFRTFTTAKLKALTTQRGLELVEEDQSQYFSIKENYYASFRSSSDNEPTSQAPSYGVWWFAFRKGNSIVEFTLSGSIDKELHLDRVFKTMVAEIKLSGE